MYNLRSELQLGILACKIGNFPFKIFSKDFIYFQIEGRKRGRKQVCGCFSYAPSTGDLARNPGMCPLLGIEPLKGLLVCRLALNPLSHTSQGLNFIYIYIYICIYFFLVVKVKHIHNRKQNLERNKDEKSLVFSNPENIRCKRIVCLLIDIISFISLVGNNTF